MSTKGHYNLTFHLFNSIRNKNQNSLFLHFVQLFTIEVSIFFTASSEKYETSSIFWKFFSHHYVLYLIEDSYEVNSQDISRGFHYLQFSMTKRSFTKKKIVYFHYRPMVDLK